MPKRLSDEELEELRQKYEEQITLRNKEAGEKRAAFIAPVQEFAASKELQAVYDQAAKIVKDPEAGNFREIRMGLEALQMSIENVRTIAGRT